MGSFDGKSSFDNINPLTLRIDQMTIKDIHSMDVNKTKSTELPRKINPNETNNDWTTTKNPNLANEWMDKMDDENSTAVDSSRT